MLGDVTTPERMDMVSSRGYAWGYIGSCVPFVVCLALVLGSEGAGPGALVRKLCDAAVTLDMAGGKTGVDSYNVSVAAGILMYNIMQRRK